MALVNSANVRQMKDFLEMFNKVTETCFNNCVTSLLDREVSSEENTCLDRCVTKILKSSHVAMNTYIELQPKIVEKRIKEYEEMSEKNSVTAVPETPEVQVKF